MFILCSATCDATTISTLASSSWNAGMQRLMLGAAGNHQAEFVALMRQAQTGQFATRKIDAVAAVALTTGGLFFRDVEDGGVGNTTYVSLVGTSNKTLIIPRGITWSAGSAAQLAVEMMFFSSDGVTAPLTVGSTAGVLTAEDSVWVGHGDGINQINVDFGLEINVPPDGYLYPRRGFVISQRPSISIVTSERGSLLTTANLNPGSVATLTATFDKLADGGVRSATQKVYSVTGHYHVEQVEGAKPGTVRLRCDGKNGLTIT